MHTHSLSFSPCVSLCFLFPLPFSMVIQTHHTENLNERGVKRTLISNRGTLWISMGLGLSLSALRPRTPCVGASTGPVSLRQAPNEPLQQDTGIREQWEPSFISWGLALPQERSICVYVCVVTLYQKHLPFSHRLHASCLCRMLRKPPQGHRRTKFHRQEWDEGEDAFPGQVFLK